MKIVQINAVYGEKSTGSIVRKLDTLLQQNDLESWVVFRSSTVPIPNGIQVGNKLDWMLHALRTRVDGKQGYASKASTQKLMRKLDCIKPDVLHLHNIHSNFLNLPIVMQYARDRQIPVILTLHDCWYFTGKCYHFADIGCEKWKYGCGQCPKRKIDIPSIMSDSSAKVFSDRMRLLDYDKLYVVGCSKWVTSLASQSPILSKAKFRTIYNGIDTELFSPNAEKKDSQFTIVTMANKWFEKANEVARNKIVETLTEKDRLIIIGCSDTEKQAYGHDERIETLDYIQDRNMLASLYGQADVFLNLTHIDTLPTVNMESISCGTPVITYDVGGSGELISQAITGYTVKPDDVEGVLKAMKQIRNGASLRKNCRLYAEKHFDMEQNFYEYLNLYRDIEKQ